MLDSGRAPTGRSVDRSSPPRGRSPKRGPDRRADADRDGPSGNRHRDVAVKGVRFAEKEKEHQKDRLFEEQREKAEAAEEYGERRSRSEFI